MLLNDNAVDLEIVYDLHWKNKSRRENINIIGMEDTPMDFNTFKSYLIQNSGLATNDDIHITYVDSEDDEISIDTDIDFNVAKTLFRKYAQSKRRVMLKVRQMKNAESFCCAPDKGPVEIAKNNSTANIVLPQPGVESQDQVDAKSYIKELKFFDATSNSGDNSPPPMSITDVVKLYFPERAFDDESNQQEDAPPQWFIKYMRNFKEEILKAVSDQLLDQVTKLTLCNAELLLKKSHHHDPSRKDERERKKKKKCAHEDTSDEGREEKHEKRHCHKMNKHERKNKLDAKLQKLEMKAMKIVAKKAAVAKASSETTAFSSSVTTAFSSSVSPVVGMLMNAVCVDKMKPAVATVLVGEEFEKEWTVKNSGSVPWTSDTVLQFSWGSRALQPVDTKIQVPHLLPGEEAVIKIPFKAPANPGRYETYFHFFHNGQRFGQWVGCEVAVVNKAMYDILPVASGSGNKCFVKFLDKCRKETAQTDQPVDLTIKSLPTTDDMKLSKAQNVVPDVLNINCAPESVEVTVPEEKKINETPKNESEPVKSEKLNDPEYVSGSDSDNISIISGSISDNSDPSEEFEVVPMPACFNFNQPLEPLLLEGKTDTEQASVSDSQKSPDSSDKNNNTELLSTRAEAASTCSSVISSVDCAASDAGAQLPVQQEVTSSTQWEIPRSNVPFPVWGVKSPSGGSESFEVLSDGKTATVSVNFENTPTSSKTPSPKLRTVGTTCLYNGVHKMFEAEPFTRMKTAGLNREVEHCAYRDHQCRHGCHTVPKSLFYSHPRRSSCSSHAFVKVTPGPNGLNNVSCNTCMHPRCIFGPSPPTEPRAFSEPPQANPSETPQAEPFFGPRKPAPYAFVFDHNIKTTQTDEPVEHKPASAQQAGSSPVATAVQILPETLVSGAVNVASSAYNTARTVIDMLRPRHDDGIPEQATPWDRDRLQALLQTLYDMGFTDRNRNIALLNRFSYDLDRVISELID